MSTANGKEPGILTSYAQRLLSGPRQAGPREARLLPPDLRPSSPPIPDDTSPPPDTQANATGGTTALDGQSSLFSVRPGVWEDYVRANQDLAERTNQALQRAGIHKRDPLSPVVKAQSEMLLQQTHMFADLVAAMERISTQQDRRIRFTMEQVEAARVAQMAQTEAVMDRMTKAQVAQVTEAAAAMQRAVDLVRYVADDTVTVHKQVQHTYEGTFREAAVDAMKRWSGRQIWRDRLFSLSAMLLIGALASWYAYSQGQNQGLHEALTDIGASDKVIAAVVDEFGMPSAIHWLKLMQWNDLEGSQQACTPPSPTASRKVCTYTFWDGPPVPDTPPLPK